MESAVGEVTKGLGQRLITCSGFVRWIILITLFLGTLKLRVQYNFLENGSTGKD